MAALVFLHFSAALAMLVTQVHPDHGLKHGTVWFIQINSCYITWGWWEEGFSHVDSVLLVLRARELDLTYLI